MPIIFDELYREFCRARLAEMRKQLLLWPGTPVVPDENCDAVHPDDAADTGSQATGRRQCPFRVIFGSSRAQPGGPVCPL